jgi:hypothetical protein
MLRFKGFSKNEEAFHCGGEDCLYGVQSTIQEDLGFNIIGPDPSVSYLVQSLTHKFFGLATNSTAKSYG